MYEKPPDQITWYDICKKENLQITIWPTDVEVPYYCRRNPELCGIETKLIK